MKLDAIPEHLEVVECIIDHAPNRYGRRPHRDYLPHGHVGQREQARRIAAIVRIALQIDKEVCPVPQQCSSIKRAQGELDSRCVGRQRRDDRQRGFIRIARGESAEGGGIEAVTVVVEALRIRKGVAALFFESVTSSAALFPISNLRCEPRGSSGPANRWASFWPPRAKKGAQKKKQDRNATS